MTLGFILAAQIRTGQKILTKFERLKLFQKKGHLRQPQSPSAKASIGAQSTERVSSDLGL
jgi:hypothetical protein